MRRVLWEMPDNEIATLLDRAITVLDELYIKAHAQEDVILLANERLRGLKKKSELWHKVETERYWAVQAAGQIDQRIEAQEQIVHSLQKELSGRNPPFWTRYDLDRINKMRDGF